MQVEHNQNTPGPFVLRTEKGWGSGRVLDSHQFGPGSVPARCHMWVEFVVNSRLALRVFLQVLWFSSLHKNQWYTPNNDLTRIGEPPENQLRQMWLPL